MISWFNYARMVVQGKMITQTIDFTRGAVDPGDNQARSNLLAAALEAGMEPTMDEYNTFVRIDLGDPHCWE